MAKLSKIQKVIAAMEYERQGLLAMAASIEHAIEQLRMADKAVSKPKSPRPSKQKAPAQGQE